MFDNQCFACPLCCHCARVEQRDQSGDSSLSPARLVRRILYGVDMLAHRDPSKGIKAETVGHLAWKTTVSNIIKIIAPARAILLVLVGHSQGAISLASAGEHSRRPSGHARASWGYIRFSGVARRFSLEAARSCVFFRSCSNRRSGPQQNDVHLPGV